MSLSGRSGGGDGDDDDGSSTPSRVHHTGPHSPATVSLLTVTELIKFLVILAAIYLSVWQYCEITTSTGSNSTVTGYAKCSFGTGNSIGEFWGIFTGIMMAISLLLYLPWRIVAIRMRFRYHIFRDEIWRPAILFYIILAAAPSFSIILSAIVQTEPVDMAPVTITVLQLVILGLVVTEWMAKIQQEYFTYDLMTDMALDFFFAYEVIAFVTLAGQGCRSEIVDSGWIYPCFIFAVIAMFKYLPTDPVDLPEFGVSWGHVMHVVMNLFFNDIPFVIIRMSTIIIFNSFLISDMIFLLKNWFMIFFSLIKLGLLIYNRKRPFDDSVPKKRRFRGPDVWCDPKDGVCRVRVTARNTITPGSSSTIAKSM